MERGILRVWEWKVLLHSPLKGGEAVQLVVNVSVWELLPLVMHGSLLILPSFSTFPVSSFSF